MYNVFEYNTFFHFQFQYFQYIVPLLGRGVHGCLMCGEFRESCSKKSEVSPDEQLVVC